MMINKVFIAIVLLSQSAFSQFDSVAYNYAQTINQSDIERIIYALASDSMLGRNTATEGQKRAESYLVEAFKYMNIAPGNGDSYLQEFGVNKRMILNIELKIDGNEINKDQLFSVSAIKGTEFESNAIVFAGYGINSDTYNDYENLEVKGKSVFILSGEPSTNGKSWVNGEDHSEWNQNMKLKINAARLAEARVLFIVRDKFKDFKRMYSRWIDSGALKLSEGTEEQFIPIVYIDKSAFLNIFNLSDKKWNSLLKKINDKGVPLTIEKKKSLKLDIKGEDISLMASNVLAAVEGTELKDEWVIISAHYDHLGQTADKVYNGADDNASGTTAVLEIAEAFKKAEMDGIKPRRSILFLLVSGEEKGLLGSKYYTQHPVYTFDKTMVDLNIDMIGRRDAEHKESNNYVYLIGADKLSKELHELSENVNTTYSHLELDYTFNAEGDPNRFYYRSDHYNFAKKNIPVIFYFNGTHEDYHQLTDTPDKIELDALQKRAQLVFYTAWKLANKDGMLILNTLIQPIDPR